MICELSKSERTKPLPLWICCMAWAPSKCTVSTSSSLLLASEESDEDFSKEVYFFTSPWVIKMSWLQNSVASFGRPPMWAVIGGKSVAVWCSGCWCLHGEWPVLVVRSRVDVVAAAAFLAGHSFPWWWCSFFLPPFVWMYFWQKMKQVASLVLWLLQWMAVQIQ